MSTSPIQCAEPIKSEFFKALDECEITLPFIGKIDFDKAADNLSSDIDSAHGCNVLNEIFIKLSMSLGPLTSFFQILECLIKPMQLILIVKEEKDPASFVRKFASEAAGMVNCLEFLLNLLPIGFANELLKTAHGSATLIYLFMDCILNLLSNLSSVISSGIVNSEVVVGVGGKFNSAASISGGYRDSNLVGDSEKVDDIRDAMLCSIKWNLSVVNNQLNFVRNIENLLTPINTIISLASVASGKNLEPLDLDLTELEELEDTIEGFDDLEPVLEKIYTLRNKIQPIRDYAKLAADTIPCGLTGLA